MVIALGFSTSLVISKGQHPAPAVSHPIYEHARIQRLIKATFNDAHSLPGGADETLD